MLNVRDVATMLHVSQSTVYAMVESGRLVSYRVGNGRGAIRVREQDLETYLESCRVEPKRNGEKPVRVPRRNLRHIKL